jgi:DNA polymerase-3 subunit alpha
MHFGTFLDREVYFFDTVHFPPVSVKYPFRGRGVYLIRGTVTEEFDVYSIEVSFIEKLPLIEDPRYSDEDSSKWKKLVS